MHNCNLIYLSLSILQQTTGSPINSALMMRACWTNYGSINLLFWSSSQLSLLAVAPLSAAFLIRWFGTLRAPRRWPTSRRWCRKRICARLSSTRPLGPTYIQYAAARAKLRQEHTGARLFPGLAQQPSPSPADFGEYGDKDGYRGWIPSTSWISGE